MLIAAFDLATKTGFAIGPAGRIERSGSRRLKDGDDDIWRADRKLGIWLRDEFNFAKPDLVVVEAPMNMGGMIEKDEKADRGFRFRSNPNTISMLNGLVHGVHTLCGPFGIRCVNANVQTVRKHFLGNARPADPKRAVIARCHQLRLMPLDRRDDNEADAIALHVWASDVHGKPTTRDLFRSGDAA